MVTPQAGFGNGRTTTAGSLRVKRLRDVGNGSSNSTPSSCFSRQITRHLRAELLAAVRHNVNSSGRVSAFSPLSLAPPLERLFTTQGLGGIPLPRSIVPESIHSTRACCRRSSSILTSTPFFLSTVFHAGVPKGPFSSEEQFSSIPTFAAWLQPEILGSKCLLSTA
jgi:hypothetical protein